jgi:hypothetical protein
MLRCWLIVGWFVAVIIWSLPPGFAVSSEADKPRLFLAALSASTTPTTIMVSIAVIVLILTVKLEPRMPY